MTRPLAKTIELYLRAWRDHNLDAILAMHTPDSIYRLHVIGEDDAVGLDAIRIAFAGVFENWPDLSFRTVRLDVGVDFFAHQMDVWGTPRNVAADADGIVLEAIEPVHFDMVDIITVRDGRIARKDSYADAMAILAATTALGGQDTPTRASVRGSR